MRFLLSVLLLSSFSLPAVSRPSAKPKRAAPVDFVIKEGDLSSVAVSEVLQKNSIDLMHEGKIIAGAKRYYETDKEAIPFYVVSLKLEPEATKALEALTVANVKKKLIIKAGGHKLSEVYLRDAIYGGALDLDPGRPKYDAKSDGSKESAQSKVSAEKLAKQLEKYVKKK